MGVDLHFGYYPKECNNKKIFPYLDVDPDPWFDSWINGKLGTDFYNLCRAYGVQYEAGDCFVFENTDKLFDFASKPEVPVKMSDYITENFAEENPLFIIWIR